MDMYVRCYVAVGMLLLLSQTSSSVPKKQSTREGNPYLALVKCGDAAGDTCSASIVSDSKVLSYCACADPAKTTVYAGVTSTSLTPDTNKQESKVARVEKHPEQEKLKIFVVKEKWNETEFVKSVKLESKKAPAGSCKLVGFGGTDGAVHVFEQAIAPCSTCSITDSDVHCTTSDTANQLLAVLDVGGPAVCSGMQYGVIKMAGKAEGGKSCNSFIDISKRRDWIEGQMKEDAPGGPDGPGGPGGPGGSNNSTASSGYSIHSYLNKYSNWKVFGFLASAIVIFLQY